MPNVRASSGMIGTTRLPKSFERMRSFRSRTNAGGGDLLRARALLRDAVRGVVRERDGRVLRAALGRVPAERAAALLHVLDGLVVLAGVVVRRQVGVRLELGVRDRHAHLVAELLEVVERELLHLVGRVATLEARAQTVALDGLGVDERGLARVLAGRLEGRVHLAVVVAAALEVPDLVVGVALDELRGALVAPEEVLADVGTALGLVGLVVAVGRAVHEVEERALGVAGEAGRPTRGPRPP